jgi:hypothetical protein
VPGGEVRKAREDAIYILRLEGVEVRQEGRGDKGRAYRSGLALTLNGGSLPQTGSGHPLYTVPGSAISADDPRPPTSDQTVIVQATPNQFWTTADTQN